MVFLKFCSIFAVQFLVHKAVAEIRTMGFKVWCSWGPWHPLKNWLAWQDKNGSLAGQKLEAWQKKICKTGRTAWQNMVPDYPDPPDRKKYVGRKGLNFGRTEWLAPPENDSATPMVIIIVFISL